jgi:hypothetical protein
MQGPVSAVLQDGYFYARNSIRLLHEKNTAFCLTALCAIHPNGLCNHKQSTSGIQAGCCATKTGTGAALACAELLYTIIAF